MSFEQLSNSLEYAPSMNTFAIKLINGSVYEAETFRIIADTEEEAKQQLASQITEYIEGKQPIVRAMPEVKLLEDGTYKGSARIATIPR